MAVEDTPTSRPQAVTSDDTKKQVKRARSEDSDQQRGSAKKVRTEGAGHTTFLDLPKEAIGRVGLHVPTDLDADQPDADRLKKVLSALKPLRLAHPRFDEALRAALPGYDAVAKLGRLSSEIYREAIPDGSFPERPPYPEHDPSAAHASQSDVGSVSASQSDAGSVSEDTTGPATAAERIRAIGPILKYQSQESRSELVKKILNIDDLPQQAAAIAATAPHIEDFTPEDRSRLFDGIVEAIHKVDFPDDDAHADVWRSSQSFLEATWSQMREEDHEKIYSDSIVSSAEGAAVTRQPPSFNNRPVSDLLRFDREESNLLELEPLTPVSTPHETSSQAEEEIAAQPARETRSPQDPLSAEVKSITDEHEQAERSVPNEDRGSKVFIRRLGAIAERIPMSFNRGSQTLLNQDRTVDRERHQNSRGR